MAGEDAKVRVGADVDPVKAAAKQAVTAWKKAGEEIRNAIGDAARAVLTDTANMVTSFGRVDLKSQMDQVRAFEAATARMAVSAGANLNGMRAHTLAISEATGRLPGQVASWADAVGKLTYDFDGAIESQKALAGLAASTGRSVDDYKGMATQLGQVGITGKAVKDVVASIAGQAAALGTKGGAAALADQFSALGDSVSMFADRSTQGIAKVLAMVGTLGRGMDAVSARRVGQAATSAITSDPRRWERYLGHHILDENGHVKDPSKVLSEIYNKSARQFGRGSESQRNVLLNNFGPELGMRLFEQGKKGNLSPDAIGKIAKETSGSPAAALAAYKNTDAGQRDMAGVKLAAASNDLLKSSGMLARAADALQQFSASHPIAGNAAAGVASGLAGVVAGNGARSLLAGGLSAGAKALGMMGTAGAVAGGALATGAALAAGAAGYGAGKALDWGTNKVGHLLGGNGDYSVSNGLSHIASGLLDKSDARIERESRASTDENEKARADRIATLERAGLKHGQAVYSADAEKGNAELKAQNDALVSAVAAGIKQGMKDVKITTRQDTPIEVTASGGSHAAAGHQG